MAGPQGLPNSAPAGSSRFAGYSDSADFVQNLRKKLTGVVEASQRIPKGEMNYLICSTYPDFVERASTASTQLTSMMQDLSAYWGVPAATYRQFENPQNRQAVVQGVNETTKQLKERMDLTLDELIRLREERASGKALPTLPVGSGSPKKVEKVRQPAVRRPQLQYGWTVDNSKNPFVPKLPTKHNALRSLEYSMREHVHGGPAPHPYQFELELFEPDSYRMKLREPASAAAPEDTPLLYVDTEDSFRSMLSELALSTEIAVDLEHHSYRTYLGITCLIQLSTRKKDYIVDAMVLRNHIYELNDVFTNPKILKIFHGANMDIQWLQRDFGVYVVNMFDTGQASRAMALAKYSLSYLFLHYLNTSVDKTHQLSDWRIRPLPDDMIAYARSDTHDLLYLYDCLRNDLIRKDPSLVLLQQVYTESKRICLQRFEKSVPDVDDFAYVMWKFAKNFSEQQKFALKNVLEWRDQVAREADESLGFVMPTKMCVDLAEALPRTSEDLVRSIEFMPNLLKQKVHQVLQIMKEARSFVGIVPMPATGIARVDDDRNETKERFLSRPLSCGQFVMKYLPVYPPPVPMGLVYGAVRSWHMVEDLERKMLEQLWAHSLTVKTLEKKAAKAMEVDETPCFVMPVSEPKDLPLAEVNPKKKDKQLRGVGQAAMDVFAQANAPQIRVPPPKTFLLPVSTSSSVAPPSASLPSKPRSPLIVTPVEKPSSKRPAFDYSTADYSKFSAPSFPNNNKRPAGRNQRGGAKDPNKSFNKRRNMSSAFSYQKPGSATFRKPE